MYINLLFTNKTVELIKKRKPYRFLLNLNYCANISICSQCRC